MSQSSRMLVAREIKQILSRWLIFFDTPCRGSRGEGSCNLISDLGNGHMDTPLLTSPCEEACGSLGHVCLAQAGGPMDHGGMYT